MPKKPDNRAPSARELLAEKSNLTHGQLAVWAADQQASSRGRFNRVLIFDLDGRLDSGAFQRAFRALVEGHDVLRMVVVEEDGVPGWSLLPALDGALSLLDFSAEADPDSTLQAWLRERCAAGFDPGQPLFHSALVRLGEQRYAWYLNQHQLITDGASIALLCRRMANLYRDALTGPLDASPSFPRYQEYIGFERRHREAPVYTHTRSYWEAKLAQPAVPLTFFGRSGGVEQKERERVTVELGNERTAGMRELCRVPGHFLNSLNLSQFLAFATLLFAFVQRASGERRLRIGTPLHNRANGPFEDTVGLFSETCPLQLELDPAETLQELLRRVMKELRSVLMHAQPGVSCAVADHPCQVVIDYLTLGCDRFRGVTSRVRQANTECGATGMLMHMQVLDFSGCDSITLQFALDADAFGPGERERLPAQFLALVDAFLNDREQALDSIALGAGSADANPAHTADVAAEVVEQASEEPMVDA